MIEMPNDARIWLEKIRLSSVPKIRDCSSYLGLVTENFLTDPICLLQIGAAVCLGKPLFFIVKKGTKLPVKMIDIADGIVEFSDETGGVVGAQEKIKEMIKQKGLL